MYVPFGTEGSVRVLFGVLSGAITPAGSGSA